MSLPSLILWAIKNRTLDLSTKSFTVKINHKTIPDPSIRYRVICLVYMTKIKTVSLMDGINFLRTGVARNLGSALC